jgi:hypothetical protein
LVSLFNAPESHDEFPRRTKAVKRCAALEQVVDGTSMDFDIDQNKTVMYSQKDNEDGMYSSLFSGNLICLSFFPIELVEGMDCLEKDALETKRADALPVYRLA